MTLTFLLLSSSPSLTESILLNKWLISMGTKISTAKIVWTRKGTGHREAERKSPRRDKGKEWSKWVSHIMLYLDLHSSSRGEGEIRNTFPPKGRWMPFGDRRQEEKEYVEWRGRKKGREEGRKERAKGISIASEKGHHKVNPIWWNGRNDATWFRKVKDE